MAKKLSDEDTENLIFMVQGYPSLWNHRHSEFKNTTKNKMWDEIAAAMDISGEEAKKRWKSLKDTFRKQMKNVPVSRSGDGGGAPTKPNWKFYDSLCFLHDVFLPSTTCGNIGQNLEPVENETQNDEQSSSSPLSSAPPHHQIVSRKERENKKRKLDAISSMQQEEPKSDDYHFFVSLLPMIEPLSHIEKLRLRAKIQNVVLEHLEGRQQTNTQPSSGYGIHHTDTSRSRFRQFSRSALSWSQGGKSPRTILRTDGKHSSSK